MEAAAACCVDAIACCVFAIALVRSKGSSGMATGCGGTTTGSGGTTTGGGTAASMGGAGSTTTSAGAAGTSCRRRCVEVAAVEAAAEWVRVRRRSERRRGALGDSLDMISKCQISSSNLRCSPKGRVPGEAHQPALGPVLARRFASKSARHGATHKNSARSGHCRAPAVAAWLQRCCLVFGIEMTRSKKPLSLATCSWDDRLMEIDAEALRYRLRLSRLRLGHQKVASLTASVAAAFDAEIKALEALEAEAVRLHEQQKHAHRFGQYLTVLSAHLEAASGGAVGMLRLPAEGEEVRQVLAEVGVPLGAPLQVLHAYRLRNSRLHDAFNKRLKGEYGAPAATAVGGAAAGSSPSKKVLPAYTHRLLAMRLSPAAVEHALVHGLKPKPPPASALDWQVDPATVPEAGCVDMKSLASIVGASIAPPMPPPLFAGAAAWETLLQGEVEEAITARDAAAESLATARGTPRSGGASGTGASSSAAATNGGSSATTSLPAANKMLLLVRVLVPLPSEAGGGGGASPERASASLNPHAKHAYPLPRHAVGVPPPGTATAAAEDMMPIYLLHYGTMTAPRQEMGESSSSSVHAHGGSNGGTGGPPAAALAMSSGSEKNVAQVEAKAVAEPRLATQQRDKGGKSSGRSSSSSQASAASSSATGKGGQSGASGPAASAALDGDGKPAALPTALRATREHSEYLACRRNAALRLREMASVFAHSIEGMVSQLTPARAQCLVEEARREAELQLLLTDAKTELAKLKKANRDLASDLQTSWASAAM